MFFDTELTFRAKILLPNIKSAKSHFITSCQINTKWKKIKDVDADADTDILNIHPSVS